MNVRSHERLHALSGKERNTFGRPRHGVERYVVEHRRRDWRRKVIDVIVNELVKKGYVADEIPLWIERDEEAARARKQNA